MARKHARLMVSVWDDEDFTSLTSVEQNVFFALISSRDLSWCGVVPYLPKRLARNASDLTERKVVAAIARLSDTRFVVVDDETDEILVRRFIHHDEVMKQPNVAKGMATSTKRVHSQHLSAVIIDELARELADEPDLKGWAAVRSSFPELFDQVCAKASGKGFGNPSVNPSVTPLAKGA